MERMGTGLSRFLMAFEKHGDLFIISKIYSVVHCVTVLSWFLKSGSLFQRISLDMRATIANILARNV